MRRGTECRPTVRPFFGLCFLVLFCVGLGHAGLGQATVILDGGIHVLLPNTPNQPVPILVSTDASDQVIGFNLQAVLGDGTGAGAEPVFSGTPGTLQGVDFTGGIWDAFASTPSGEAPVAGFPQYATPSVLFDMAGDEVTASGLVATLYVDTTGFASGTFPLTLDGSVSPLGASDFVVTGGGSITPAIANGSIRIVSPVVGVAKRVVSVTDVGGGSFDVAFRLVVENLGAVALSNVQVADDLTAGFPAPATFSIQSGPVASPTLVANGDYDGVGDTDLLTTTSTLGLGASATIDLTVRLAPNGAAGPFQNAATASAQSPGGAATSDSSDDGADPDPNGNGDPDEAGENDPTPVILPRAPSIELVKSGVVDDENGDGIAQVGEAIVYSFEVTNTGNTVLSNAVVSDPLASPIMCPGGNPISTLSPGQTVTCTGTYVLSPADLAAGERLNTATVEAMDPPGGLVSDEDTVTVELVTVDIPTLSETGLALLGALLAAVALLAVRRDRF